MKFFATILFSVIISSSLFAQATASANEMISAANIATINLDLDTDNIEIKETKGSRIIIESHIKLATVNNSAMLDFLVNSGRYALESTTDATTQTLNITRKKNMNVLLVKGEECKEIISYIVLVPASVKVVNTKSPTASIK
ncbi:MULTISPECIES: hypothetical protein [unclassified Aureispira]|uniref:hypothetical protein n=1 Tax=unclassified Aureispira TaxID=2649989 RepID=UPI0006962D0E|nr:MULTISPECIES: hypothetical protein [unclassified Aureispira]WMX14523.1 hypothetical protein QP953_27070 [Aureispira sp. CCB-E]